MFRTLFGGVQDGRLQRLPYLGWHIALTVLMVLVGLGIGAGIGIAERMVGGSLAESQALIAERFGIVGMIAVVVVFGVLLFAHANIAAKRVRDTGLPGWWVILAAVIVGVLISAFAGQQASGLWTLATTLALLLIPSNAFGGGEAVSR
ncbi:MAG: DUF805 domain-containing protein [Candidatus Competibacter sp.]